MSIYQLTTLGLSFTSLLPNHGCLTYMYLSSTLQLNYLSLTPGLSYVFNISLTLGLNFYVFFTEEIMISAVKSKQKF